MISMLMLSSTVYAVWLNGPKRMMIYNAMIQLSMGDHCSRKPSHSRNYHCSRSPSVSKSGWNWMSCFVASPRNHFRLRWWSRPRSLYPCRHCRLNELWRFEIAPRAKFGMGSRELMTSDLMALVMAVVADTSHDARLRIRFQCFRFHSHLNLQLHFDLRRGNRSLLMCLSEGIRTR